jgi:NADH:ubiquinone oxidoreductase subunit H
MTELSAIPFVLFFLAEYAALLLIASVTSALFLGGFPTGVPLPLAAATFGLKTNLVLFFYI